MSLIIMTRNGKLTTDIYFYDLVRVRYCVYAIKFDIGVLLQYKYQVPRII